MTTMCILSKILYVYFEIKVFKAQLGYGGTQKCKIIMFSEGFYTLYFKLKSNVRHWGHVQMLYFQCFSSFLITFLIIYLKFAVRIMCRTLRLIIKCIL